MSLSRLFMRGLQPRPLPPAISGAASRRLVPSITLSYFIINRQLHTKKSPQHVIRDAYTPRHVQVHRIGKLLQSGFKLPYLGPHFTWLLLRLRLQFSHIFPVKFHAHHYRMAEEAIRGQLLDPTSKEKDAISAASIMLKAVATTQSWRFWYPDNAHIPSIPDLHAMEDANYALRHFKANHRVASPYSVLEDDLHCLWGIPRRALRNAQELTELNGELVDDLRLVAGKQLDQVEQDARSTRAKELVQNVGVPLAQRLSRHKALLRDACSSRPLAEQLSAELDSAGIMEFKHMVTYLPKIKGADPRKTLTATLLFDVKEPFPIRQLSLFRELEKRYVNVISRVVRLPDRKSKENLLAVLDVQRAKWAILAARSKWNDWQIKYDKKR